MGRMLGLVVLTYLLACLLAPMLWACGTWGVAHGLTPKLATFGFDTYVSRALLVAVLIMLLPLIRVLNVRKLSDIYLAREKFRWRDVWAGFAVGAGMTALVCATLTRQGFFCVLSAPSYFLVASALLAALAIATVEEILFRGLFFGAARRAYGSHFAAYLGALVFACLHLVRSSRHLGEKWVGEVSWGTGFSRANVLLGDVCRPDRAPWLIATLLLLGLVCARGVIKTKSLSLPIGFHAGLIFAMKMRVYLLQPISDGMPWVGPDPREGLAALAVLLLSDLTFQNILRHRKKREPLNLPDIVGN